MKLSTPSPATSTTLPSGTSQPLEGHRSTLLLLVLAYTVSITDRMILSILFPDIKAEFGLSDSQLGLLGGLSFALFYATMGLPIAKLSDRFSRKSIIIASLVVFSLMTALSGWAAGFITLLLFRIGVGIGEAGVNPASHSILADYYPPKRRAFAMATLMLGTNLGMMLGFVGGGFIAEAYNWRIALMAVGILGLPLALVMTRYLREPARGMFEQGTATLPPPVLTTAATMWANPAIRHIVAGSVVMGMMTYGFAQWMPTFFIRSHEVSQSQAGMLMAGLFGIVGAIGALVAGKLFDRLSHRGFQYGLWLIAAAQVLALPFMVVALLADNLTIALLLFAIPAFTSNFFLGPTIALIQTLSPVNMRAVASAIKMLCLNLIGMGLGPLVVGALSDVLTPYYGESALQVAMACFTVVGLWGALHLWLCGRALAANPPATEPR
jgi:predicted MFS family arabinose efflux permease